MDGDRRWDWVRQDTPMGIMLSPLDMRAILQILVFLQCAVYLLCYKFISFFLSIPFYFDMATSPQWSTPWPTDHDCFGLRLRL